MSDKQIYCTCGPNQLSHVWQEGCPGYKAPSVDTQERAGGMRWFCASNCSTSSDVCGIDKCETYRLVLSRISEARVEERKHIAELKTVLGAWYNIFGTTQLSHAEARLRAAEDMVLKLEQSLKDDRAVTTELVLALAKVEGVYVVANRALALYNARQEVNRG